MICHYLKNASCPNGDIGDVMASNYGMGCYGVHFDDKSLEPVAVKKEHMCIIFEFPY